MKRLSFLAALLLGMVVLVACPRGTVTGPLAAPSNLQATPGSGEIVLTWQDNSTAEEGFRIYRKLETDEEFSDEPLATTLPDTETYPDESVSAAETYVYQVRAFAGASEGELSQASNAAKPTLAENKATLSVLREGGGDGTTTSSPTGINCVNSTGGACSLDVDLGSSVVLTANPDEAKVSVFGGFSSNCEVITPLSCTVVVDAAKEVTASYLQAQPGITVQLSGDPDSGRVVDSTTDAGSPYINCGGSGTDCSEDSYWQIGNDVTLYAEPSGGSLFAGWEGCDTVREGRGLPNGRCDFKVKAVTVISAKFLRDREDPTATLTANPTVVAPTGTNVTLSWTVDDKGSAEPFTLELTDSQGNNYSDRIPDTETGSVVIGVSSSRTFTLRVTNVFGTNTATASVTLGQVPTIGTFSATPPQLPSAGGDVTLRWSDVTGVDSPSSTLVIQRTPGADINVKDDADNTIVVPQTATTTYTLVADNEFGDPVSSPTRTVTVSDLEAPTITGFAAAPNPSPASGTPITFTWTPGGGAPTFLRLNPGAIDIPLTASSYTLTPGPEATTTYTLTARNNASGTEPTTASVEVVVTPPAPVILNFSPTDDTIATGGTATFTWSFGSSGGTPLSTVILKDETPGGSGETEVPVSVPTDTQGTAPVTAAVTRFRLRSSNDGGDGFSSSLADRVIVRTGAEPVITAPVPTPLGIIDPISYEVTWILTAGDGTISYELLDPNSAVVPGLTITGSPFTFTPAVSGEYTLRATNEFGDTANAPGIGEGKFSIP